MMVDKAAYKEFAVWCLAHAFDGLDIDGGELQRKAASLGIITEIPYDPDLHGPNFYVRKGDPWFVMVEDA